GSDALTTGTQTITATDTVSGSVNGTSGGVTVTAASADHFTVSAPTSATAGSSFSYTVTAVTTTRGTDTGYRGTVHLTSSDALAGLPSDYTFTAGDAGAHTFAATLYTEGRRSVTATDTVTSAITGAAPVNVTDTATHFGVVAPSSALPGVPFGFTVTAL